MRKLARQAIIFALLGFVLTFIVLFAILGRNIATRARTDAAVAVHAEIEFNGLPAGSTARPMDTVDVPLTNGTILHVRECQQYWRGRLDETEDCRFFSDRYRQLTFIPVGDPRQIAIEKDYWAAYRKSSRKNLLWNALFATGFGIRWGFLGGLGSLILCRLMQFATKRLLNFPGFVYAGRVIRSNAFTIGLVIFIEICGYVFENQKEVVPWLVDLELKSHAALSGWEARKPRVERVFTIEIDDETYFNDWKDPGITPREKLAEIAMTAADAGAAVIAMDIDLSADPSEEIRKDANQCLLQTICEITERGIGVVLTSGLSKEKDSSQRWWKPESTTSTWEPNIYDDEVLPPGTRVGFDNGPNDPRQIPLVLTAKEPSGHVRTRRSFALEIVDAYEEAIHVISKKKTVNNPDVRNAIHDKEFIYGSFLKPDEFGRCLDFTSDEFPCVSARDLPSRNSPCVRKLDDASKKMRKYGDVDPTERLKHRIVIIGGNRHAGYKRGEWVDDHKSPVGNMRGLYFHANYVEALLDHRLKVPVNPWFGLSFNLVLAVSLIYCFKAADGPWRRWGILAIVLTPLIGAYFMWTNLKYSLDFVLPMALLLFKLFLEHYFDLRRMAKNAAQPL